MSIEGLPAFSDVHVLPIRVRRRNTVVAFANEMEREFANLFPTWQKSPCARLDLRKAQLFLKYRDRQSYRVTYELL